MRTKYKDLMDTCDVSKYLGYNTDTIQNWCRNGKIIYSKEKGKYIFNKRIINVLLENGIIIRKDK